MSCRLLERCHISRSFISIAALSRGSTSTSRARSSNATPVALKALHLSQLYLGAAHPNCLGSEVSPAAQTSCLSWFSALITFIVTCRSPIFVPALLLLSASTSRAGGRDVGAAALRPSDRSLPLLFLRHLERGLDVSSGSGKEVSPAARAASRPLQSPLSLSTVGTLCTDIWGLRQQGSCSSLRLFRFRYWPRFPAVCCPTLHNGAGYTVKRGTANRRDSLPSGPPAVSNTRNS
jgi:hypothetical protein